MKLEEFDDYIPKPADPHTSPSDSAEGAAIDDNPADDPTPPRRYPWRRIIALCVFITAAVLAAIGWIRYFNPYAEDARVTGYITSVERRGIFFKTFEGQMITSESLTDTTRVYSRDFNFSIPDDSLALAIQSYQGSGRPVTLTYERYYGALPWRGSSLAIITSVTPN